MTGIGQRPALLDRVPAWTAVKPLMRALNRAGYRSWLVGGAVRDLLSGRTPDDLDLLTTARPDEIQHLFQDRKVRMVGSSFQVTLVDGVEMASCPELEDFVYPADLGRRDLTINSMAMDPFTGRVVDPFGGQKDLDGRIIRFTRDPSARIQEDPLRMVRACRFAAVLDGEMDSASLEAIVDHRDLIAGRTAPERIRGELIKAMAQDRPSRFFVLLCQTGLLAHILPCLDRCRDLDGGPNHGETVFEHCMLVGDALPAKDPLLRLAGFLHDVGKYEAAELKEGQLTFHGHETCDQALARDLGALRFSKKEIARILSLVRAHMRPLTHESSPKAVRRLLAMLDDLDLDYREFIRLRIADKKGNLAKPPYTLSQIKLRLGKIMAELKSGHALTLKDLAISGRTICDLLNLRPGPGVGQVKEYLYAQVLRDPDLNTPEQLAELVRKYTP